jgi:hypothetical protein
MDNYKTQTYLASSGRNLDKDGILDDATKSKSKRVSGVDKMKRYRNLARKHQISNHDSTSGNVSNDHSNSNFRSSSSSHSRISIGQSNHMGESRATTTYMARQKSSDHATLLCTNHKRLPLQKVDANSPKRMASRSMTVSPPLGNLLKHTVRNNRQPSPSVSPLQQQEQRQSVTRLGESNIKWMDGQGEEKDIHAMFQGLSESIKQDNNRTVQSWYEDKGKEESLSHFDQGGFQDEFEEFMEEMARELSIGHVEVRDNV